MAVKRQAIRSFHRDLPLRTALLYALLGALWIALSDRALLWVLQDPELVIWAQTYKGWFFVFTTALLLFIFIRNRVLKMERLERANAQNQTRLEEVVHAARLGLWEWDLRSNHVHYWPDWARMLGYDKAEIQPERREWESRIHPEDLPDVLAAVRELITTPGSNYQGEYRMRHKDGTYRWILTNASLLREQDGHPVSMLGAHTDITHAKHLEKQLLQTQRLESVGRLASGIAHDLNNILLPILVGTDLLEIEISTEQGRSILKSIKNSSRRGSEIIRQLLTFGKGTDGKHIEFEVASILREMEVIIRETFPRSIELELKVEPGTSSVMGDPTQIHQVLMNLCVNASDAMPEGGKLLLALQNWEPGDPVPAPPQVYRHAGTLNRILVKDSGEGIRPEDLDKIFDPFYTTKAPGKGTGLGLSTSISIVHQHGGCIQVESTPGRGTSFAVFLPTVVRKEETGLPVSNETGL